MVLKGPPTMFAAHNSAVNRTVSLHTTSHSLCHSKFFPFSCSYLCISLLIALLSFPPLCWEGSPSRDPMLGQLGSREEAPLARGCWKTLLRVVSQPPSSHPSHPHTPLSLFIFERLEYHRIKRLQLCWGKETSHASAIYGQFPINRR